MMKRMYLRNIKMRDLEEIADLPENRQACELVARCFGLEIDEVLDMDASEFQECSKVVQERNGLDGDD